MIPTWVFFIVFAWAVVMTAGLATALYVIERLNKRLDDHSAAINAHAEALRRIEGAR